MRKIVYLLLLVLIISLVFLIFNNLHLGNPQSYSITEKIYVAVEGEGKIAVVDPSKNSVIKNIDLSLPHEGGTLMFSPHNVQVAPDGKTVWVTANIGVHENHSRINFSPAYAHENEENQTGEQDQVIVIDPTTDQITKRVPAGIGIHLAHVVVSADGFYAYVSAQKEGAIYKLNTTTYAIEKKIETPKNSEPHGLRISSDGQKVFIAMLKGESLGILDTKTGTLSNVPLDGQAVQVATTPDGKFALASVYDTKQIALYDISQKSLSYIPLPANAKGPVQLYPSPDSQFIYVADQGYYFDQPTGDTVYKIDLNKKKVTTEIIAGNAPHGVVVSKDGKFTYVTNLLSGDVSVINNVAENEIARIKVGREPNGVSIWSKQFGGTP